MEVPLSLTRMDRQREMVRMDDTRVEDCGKECLSRLCGGGREVGGKIKVPASHWGFRPVRWSRSSGTGTATNSEHLRHDERKMLCLHATTVRQRAKSCYYSISTSIRTRKIGLVSSGTTCLSRADGNKEAL